jgi:hypothetical protein
VTVWLRTWILLLFLIPVYVSAQKKNKKQDEEKKSVTQRAYREGLKLISTTLKDTIVNTQSADLFEPHAGKIIRNIYIQRINFERSIYDTAKKINHTLIKLADAMHGDTREKTIRQHLFITAHEPVVPGKLSDNERFLRDLDFILDSRILVTPAEGSDSVDLVVVTRDVFSLGFSFGNPASETPFARGSASGQKLTLYDANIGGRGQRLEYTALVSPDRTPYLGNAIRFRKSSLFGSLGNFELGYTQINTNRSIGDENEYAVYTQYNRPLVSAYTRLAGGFELSRNWSENVYNQPDSIFQQYKYTVFDSWMGINMGIHRASINRQRKFLAVRYFNGRYLDQPEQAEFREERRYNDMIGLLSELTFYKQDFYKTRYVYGFGRTEDIPYGYSLGFTGGYTEEISASRPYAAIKATYQGASPKGYFYSLIVQAGGYFNDVSSSFEDVVLLTDATYYSRVLNMNRYKLRALAAASWSRMINQRTAEWLALNPRILPGFRQNDLDASERSAVRIGATLFTPWTLIGFRMAPIVTLDIVKVSCLTCENPNPTFMGITGGLRVRNENLIFGTLEFKATYIPSNQNGEPEFVFRFTQNIRVKNTSYFVRPPALVIYN